MNDRLTPTRVTVMTDKRVSLAVIRARVSDRAGFTLLEVLIAVVILSVGILGVTAMQTASLNSALLTRNIDNCVFVASDVLDRISANPADIAGYTGGTYSDFVVTSSGGCGTSSSDVDQICNNMLNMQYRNATLTVSFRPDVPLDGLDTVTATLTWPHKGDTKQCVAETIVTRR